MANPSVFGSVPSHVIDYPYGGGSSLAWTPVVAADFVSTNPFTDPNSLVNAPISVHASNGNITFTLNEYVVAYDGIAEGALWRLNWPAAWKGDGTQMLIFRLTPISGTVTGTAGPQRYFVGFCGCDGGGNPTVGTPVGSGVAISGAGALGQPYTNVEVAVATNTSGTYTGANGTIANGAVGLGWIYPAGVTGDESQVGNPGGTSGTAMVQIYETVTSTMMYTHSIVAAGTLSDGYYPCIYASYEFGGGGGVTTTFTVRFEWAIADRYPLNEFA